MNIKNEIEYIQSSTANYPNAHIRNQTDGPNYNNSGLFLAYFNTKKKNLNFVVIAKSHNVFGAFFC